MGFFQELKEDLSQAVNELAPGEDVETVELPAEDEITAFDEQSIFASEDTTDVVDATPAFQEESGFGTELEETADNSYTPAEEVPVYQPTYSEPAAAPVESSSSQPHKEAPPIPVIGDMPSQEVSDEVGVITRMMTINGDVVSSGSLDLIGAVRGNIKILGKLNITGSLVGDAEAAEVYAQEAQIAGNISSTGSVKVGQNTVIRGNIYANSAVIAGAVKGDIDIHGPVILDSTAIVMGNIKSKAVQINNGAAIEGMCSQCYADVSPSSFFKD